MHLFAIAPNPIFFSHFGKYGAASNDKENVEDCRSDDGADADFALGDEDAEERSEEFRRRSAGGHECGAGNIIRQRQFFG